MKFCIEINKNSSHQVFYTNLMRKALLNNGLEETNLKNCDFVVTWAWKPERRGTTWFSIKNSGKPVLIMERAYIGDRMVEWTSIGWNGLNGRADFCNKNSPNDRVNKYYNNILQPYKDYDETLPVLVIGQCFHDASVSHVNINSWYDKVISNLRNIGHKVLYRPHPLNNNPYIGKVDFDKNIKLEDTFKQVKSVVTFNSNCGVLAAIAGLPIYCEDIGAMSYNIASHDLENLNMTFDRTQWLNDMSYTQWSNKEIEDGTAWNHLQKFLNPIKELVSYPEEL